MKKTQEALYSLGLSAGAVPWASRIFTGFRGLYNGPDADYNRERILRKEN
jgi:hypothetical protein